MATKAGAIADAVAAWLNDPARDWALGGWTAERVWAADLELKDAAAAPVVEVVAPEGAEPFEDDTRAGAVCDWAVWVLVRQRYPASGAIPNGWLDDRAGLAEAVTEGLNGVNLTVPGAKRANVTGTQLLVLNARHDLREYRTAASVVEATVRVWS